MGFKICNCSAKGGTTIINKNKPSILESLFDDQCRHPTPGSVFVFNGLKWTICKQCDLDIPKTEKHVHENHVHENHVHKYGECKHSSSTGPRGERGYTGAPGPIGPTGPRGEKGEKGDTGSVQTKGTEIDHNTSFGIHSGTGSVMNTFYGYKSGSKETSSENTYIGHLAGEESSSTGKNVFIGNEVGRYSNGAQNTYIGDGVCSENKSDGSYNTFIGAEAGLKNTEGFGNTFVGVVSGSSNTEGNWNIFMGQSSGQKNVDGTNNIFIGTNSGSSNVEGNSCICIGDGSDVSSDTAVNQIVIGQAVTGHGDNTITFPDNLTSFSSGTEVNFSSANGGCLYPLSSSRRWKTNIRDIEDEIDTENLYKLRPVIFNPAFGHGDPMKTDVGFIAEEVDEHFPVLVPKDETGQPASVKYSLLNVLTVAEIKKLKERLDKVERILES